VLVIVLRPMRENRPKKQFTATDTENGYEGTKTEKRAREAWRKRPLTVDRRPHEKTADSLKSVIVIRETWPKDR